MKRKILSLLICLTVMFSLSICAFADGNRLVDNACLLSDSEASTISAKLDRLSNQYGFDIVIVTVDWLDGKSPMEFADDYFDYNGYGQGDDRSGALLLISMEDNDWYVSTRGYGITAITDAGLDYMSDQFVPYLSDGDFYGAFDKYANLCAEFVDRANIGDPYDSDNIPKEPFNIPKNFGISVLIGFVIALFVVMGMKSKLKSVQMSSGAANYTKSGSVNVKNAGEIFLFTNVNRVPKVESSGGGTHISSSGASHGGGGGKF